MRPFHASNSDDDASAADDSISDMDPCVPGSIAQALSVVLTDDHAPGRSRRQAVFELLDPRRTGRFTPQQLSGLQDTRVRIAIHAAGGARSAALERWFAEHRGKDANLTRADFLDQVAAEARRQRAGRPKSHRVPPSVENAAEQSEGLRASLIAYLQAWGIVEPPGAPAHAVMRECPRLSPRPHGRRQRRLQTRVRDPKGTLSRLVRRRRQRSVSHQPGRPATSTRCCAPRCTARRCSSRSICSGPGSATPRSRCPRGLRSRPLGADTCGVRHRSGMSNFGRRCGAGASRPSPIAARRMRGIPGTDDRFVHCLGVQLRACHRPPTTETSTQH